MFEKNEVIKALDNSVYKLSQKSKDLYEEYFELTTEGLDASTVVEQINEIKEKINAVNTTIEIVKEHQKPVYRERSSDWNLGMDMSI